MTAFWQRRVVQPILLLLKQGLTPEKLALTIALGLAMGTIPVLGATSLACALTAAILGLNQGVIQGVNYLAYPLQLALLIPFLKLGSVLFADSSFHLGFSEFKALIQTGIFNAIQMLWTVTCHGIIAWAMVVFPIAAILYTILLPILKVATQKQQPS